MMQPTSGIPQKKAEIIERYNNNVQVKKIAEDLGFNYLTLRKYIVKWKKDGSLPKGRHRPSHEYPATRKSPQKKKVEPTQKTEKAEPQVEEVPLVDIDNLDSRIDKRKAVDRENVSIMQYNHSLIVWNEEPVKCTREVSMNCVWGTCETSPNLCDFLCRNGRSRGCHWKECHRFVQVTEETPKARSPFIV